MHVGIPQFAFFLLLLRLLIFPYLVTCVCVCVCVDICRYGSVSVHAYQLVGLFGYVIYRPGVLSSRGEL